MFNVDVGSDVVFLEKSVARFKDGLWRVDIFCDGSGNQSLGPM